MVTIVKTEKEKRDATTIETIGTMAVVTIETRGMKGATIDTDPHRQRTGEKLKNVTMFSRITPARIMDARFLQL